MSVIDAVDGHRLRHPRAIAKWLNFRRNAASILCALPALPRRATLALRIYGSKT